MKANVHTKLGATLSLWILLTAIPLAAQSRNPEALNWFKIGLQEKDAPTKIVAYRKALALDSLFVEAWYNLGMTYKKQQDLPHAEHCLQRAHVVRKGNVAKELQAVIAYELGMTHKKLGKQREYETRLLEAKVLAEEQKTKTRILLELGRFYNEREEYAKALAELREGQQLDPENSELTKLKATIETASALQQLYLTALQNMNTGKLQDAKTQFASIAAQAPAYKDVPRRIVELDSLLEAENKKQVLALAYEQAQSHETAGQFELAISGYENVLQRAPQHKDAQARLEHVRQLLTNKLQAEKSRLLESEYAAGTAALKKQDWTNAIIAFKRVLEIEPNFRDTRNKQAEAQSGLSGESLNVAVARFYEDGVAAMKSNNAQEALAAFEKVRLLNPNYRDLAARLQELAKVAQPAGMKPPMPQVAVSASTPLDSLYHSALSLMIKEQWPAAIKTLDTLQALHSNYRDVPELLARAQRHLPGAAPDTLALAQAETGAAKRYTVLLWSCGFVLALVAFYFLSAPTTRARLLLLRGKKKEAQNIYEKLLARNPQQLSLYSALAGIYLGESRNDDNAMRIYKKALQLDLPERKRKELRSFVTQVQLAEAAANGEAHTESHAR